MARTKEYPRKGKKNMARTAETQRFGTIRRYRRLIFACPAASILIVLCLFSCLAGLPFARVALAHEERDDLGYYEVLTEEGDPLFETGHVITVGDRFIDEDNALYEVYRVEQDKAYARRVGKAQPAKGTSQLELDDVLRGKRTGLLGAIAVIRSIKEVALVLKEVVVQRLSDVIPTQGNQGDRGPSVGIYSTHSDESYAPSDGSPSIRGHGGVFKVAASLASTLRKSGIEAIVSYTLHHPHDAGAYDRSRRTAMDLVRRRPSALIDVHRDTAPAEAYRDYINGKVVTKVMLVVGRQNPGMQANLNFAKRLKEAADRRYPGLVRGIFFANGKYNQDLHPHALLWEVGSYENPRYEAESGASLLGEVLSQVIGAVGPGAPTESRRGLSLAAWVIGLLIVGTVVYLFLSTGSWEEAKAKLRRIRAEEFSSLLGWKDFVARRREGKARLEIRQERRGPSGPTSGGSLSEKESRSKESRSIAKTQTIPGEGETADQGKRESVNEGALTGVAPTETRTEGRGTLEDPGVSAARLDQVSPEKEAESKEQATPDVQS